MENFLITGIQQVGVGTLNFEEAWKWYIDMFQVDVRILEDDTVAERMLPYTGGVPQKRHACIAMNLRGGGGFEIWQYSERKPCPIDFQIQVGDLGIFAAKVKSNDVAALHQQISEKYSKVSSLQQAPDGRPTFWVEDPWGNFFQVVHDNTVYIRDMGCAGGVVGAMIGVSDIDRALTVYRDILGFDQVVYDQTGDFKDWTTFPGGTQRYRRVLLTHSQPRQGAFSQLFGRGEVELVVALERQPRKIYEGRYWGDPGFIQLCMDVVNMRALGKFCAEKGFPFTVDSCADQSHFDMGDASGHFTYIEDPDGTLIEFVETHKIPIAKKLGWFLDLQKRNRVKPLPKWILSMLRFSKVKF